MSEQISINVFEREGEILTDINEVDVNPGDVLVVASSVERNFNLFFGPFESTHGETGSTFGPFGPGDGIPPIPVPFDASGEPAAPAFHVMAIDAVDWPRILIRRPIVQGER